VKSGLLKSLRETAEVKSGLLKSLRETVEVKSEVSQTLMRDRRGEIRGFPTPLARPQR